jgi:hypothetical protein
MKGEKKFDCIKMKREIQARIYEEIKDLSHEEEMEYWRRKVEESPWGARFRAERESQNAR